MEKDSNDLSLFQQWVLFYFLKHTDVAVDSETLADNMCLTAVINFKIGMVEPELGVLARHNLINRIDRNNKVTYASNLTGRFYVKQNILAPLVKIKSKNKIKGLIIYLKKKGEQESLVEELKLALNESDQGMFITRISEIALNKMGPFVNMMKKVGFFETQGDPSLADSTLSGFSTL